MYRIIIIISDYVAIAIGKWKKSSIFRFNVEFFINGSNGKAITKNRENIFSEKYQFCSRYVREQNSRSPRRTQFESKFTATLYLA